MDAAATASRGLLRPRALVSTASITLRRHPHLNRMSLEVRLEDLERCGSRRRATVTAVLDQRTDRDRRRVCGRVPAPPGLVELAGEAGDARALLGRAEAGTRRGQPVGWARAGTRARQPVSGGGAGAGTRLPLGGRGLGHPWGGGEWGAGLLEVRVAGRLDGRRHRHLLAHERVPVL